MRHNAGSWFALRAVLIVQTAGLAALAQSGNNVDPPKVGIDQNLGAQIPLDLTLVDESGRRVTMRHLMHDKPAILTLVYYQCPMLCGQVLDGLLKSMEKMIFNVGDEFDVLTLSIDPAETPTLAAEKKKNYVARYGRSGAEQGWRFLTGAAKDIRALADTVGFRYRYDPETKQFAHAAGIMVLTPDGRVARYFYGIDYPPGDLRLGLVEASGGKIGSAVDQLLLLCYHYDPTRGRYGLVIINVIRIAGAITVLAIATFIFFMIRHERKRLVASAAVAPDELSIAQGRERPDA